MPAQTITTASEGMVLDFIHAINEERFDDATNLMADDFSFKGVMGTRNGAKAYIDDMRKIKIKYKILKVLADENDVSVLCDYTMQGKTLPGTSWYTVENGKITSLKAIFDPRPVL